MMKTYLKIALFVAVALISTSSAEADGWFEIKAVHSGKCVEVKDSGKANYDLIDQSTCTQGDNQLWKWSGKRLQNKGSGKCLDVTGRSVENAVQLQQWGCANVPNQTFTYTNDKRLVAQHSEKCVDVAGARANDGEKVIQYQCKPDNYKNQQFDLVSVKR